MKTARPGSFFLLMTKSGGDSTNSKIEKLQKLKCNKIFEKEKKEHFVRLLRRYYSLLNQKKKLIEAWDIARSEMDDLEYGEENEKIMSLRAIMRDIEKKYATNEKKTKIQEAMVAKEINNAETLEKAKAMTSGMEFALKTEWLLRRIKQNFLADLVVATAIFIGGYMQLSGEAMTIGAALSCAGISLILVGIARVMEELSKKEKDRLYMIYTENYSYIIKKMEEILEKKALEKNVQK